MLIKKLTAAFLLLLTLTSIDYAQWGGGEKYPNLKPHEESLQKLKDMRFGIFMHWGPSAIRGTSGWARGNHPYDYLPRIPIDEYDSLYLQFNPVLFDAKEWINMVKGSGAKYYVITTKHHDGFSIWDSKYSEYDIMSTPYPKDVLKQLSEECYKQGIYFGTYYSICDWSHPEYPGRYGGDPRPVENSDMNKYVSFMKHQLDELIDEYKTNILWFDGYWEDPWTHERGMELYKYLRDKKFDLLINNRVDRMRADEEGKINPQKYAGDYMTPEQEVGEFEIDHLWESCITISDGWYYSPQGKLKSLKELIDLLVQTVGGGGNLLLNVGPMPDGRIEMFQKKRLLEMGNWLNNYGESIYGTNAGPFKPNDYSASTRKDNKIFIHVLDWLHDTLYVPLIEQEITKSYLLNGNDFNFEKTGDAIKISIPIELRTKFNTVLILETDDEANKIEVKQPVYFKNIKTASLDEQPNKKYSADGERTLVDNKIGTNNIYENWLGFEEKSLSAVVDLKQLKNISNVQIGFYQNQGNWIFMPKKVELFISSDGNEFEKISEQSYPIIRSNENKRFVTMFNLDDIETKYVKIVAENIEKCPNWHKGSGGKAWLFVDEISIK
ncbi:MAG: alpha-L-fucosidase [Ignavibacteriales bacterium]|nr:alpha-L-fucosidase [Ignavibacteriales bacterium]